MTQPKCETCKWWTPFQSPSPDGLCRKRPPQAFYGEGMDNGFSYRFCETVWPTTNRADFCGEHTEKDAAP